jgi:hypothetical protein
MNLKDFIEQEKKDSNLFWRLSSGIHKNMLDEAIDEIERLKSIIDLEPNTLEFACHITGHNEETIIQMYDDWLKSPERNNTKD